MEDDDQLEVPEPMDTTEIKSKTAVTLPFIEKFRPENLDDVISQDDIVSTRIFILFISKNFCEK